MAEDQEDFFEEDYAGGGDNPPKKDSTTDWLMISVAGFVDFFQFILNFAPFIGGVLAGIVTIFAELGFLLWFKLRGMSYKKNSTFMVTWIVVPIIELIPFLNALPSFSAGVITTIIQSRAQEKIKEKIPFA